MPQAQNLNDDIASILAIHLHEREGAPRLMMEMATEFAAALGQVIAYAAAGDSERIEHLLSGCNMTSRGVAMLTLDAVRQLAAQEEESNG